MAAKLYNLARVTTATVGAGTITLGAAAPGCLTFADAGVQDGDTVSYAVQDGANSEVGRGVYSVTGPTLTRSVLKSTNANSAISLSGTAQVFISALAEDLDPTTRLSPASSMVNGSLVASVASNILTVAVKTRAGVDPSPADPVYFCFRNATLATGDYTVVAVTAALSITTNATGATLGAVNSIPFRLWVLAFNNAGTVVLALWQSVTGGSAPTAWGALNEGAIVSTTGISGSATSAATFYTPNGTSLSSKTFRILGYLDYASGLTTAGTYASGPTAIRLFGPGIYLPGQSKQSLNVISSTTQALATTTKTASTGLTLSITPSDTINVIKAQFDLTVTPGGTVYGFAQISRGSAPTLLGSLGTGGSTLNGDYQVLGRAWDRPSTASAQAYTVYCWCSSATSVTFNNGTGSLSLEEIMV